MVFNLARDYAGTVLWGRQEYDVARSKYMTAALNTYEKYGLCVDEAASIWEAAFEDARS